MKSSDGENEILSRTCHASSAPIELHASMFIQPETTSRLKAASSRNPIPMTEIATSSTAYSALIPFAVPSARKAPPNPLPKGERRRSIWSSDAEEFFLKRRGRTYKEVPAFVFDRPPTEVAVRQEPVSKLKAQLEIDRKRDHEPCSIIIKDLQKEKNLSTKGPSYLFDRPSSRAKTPRELATAQYSSTLNLTLQRQRSTMNLLHTSPKGATPRHSGSSSQSLDQSGRSTLTTAHGKQNAEPILYDPYDPYDPANPEHPNNIAKLKNTVTSPKTAKISIPTVEAVFTSTRPWTAEKINNSIRSASPSGAASLPVPLLFALKKIAKSEYEGNEAAKEDNILSVINALRNPEIAPRKLFRSNSKASRGAQSTPPLSPIRAHAHSISEPHVTGNDTMGYQAPFLETIGHEELLQTRAEIGTTTVLSSLSPKSPCPACAPKIAFGTTHNSTNLFPTSNCACDTSIASPTRFYSYSSADTIQDPMRKCASVDEPTVIPPKSFSSRQSKSPLRLALPLSPARTTRVQSPSSRNNDSVSPNVSSSKKPDANRFDIRVTSIDPDTRIFIRPFNSSDLRFGGSKRKNVPDSTQISDNPPDDTLQKDYYAPISTVQTKDHAEIATLAATKRQVTDAIVRDVLNTMKSSPVDKLQGPASQYSMHDTQRSYFPSSERHLPLSHSTNGYSSSSLSPVYQFGDAKATEELRKPLPELPFPRQHDPTHVQDKSHVDPLLSLNLSTFYSTLKTVRDGSLSPKDNSTVPDRLKLNKFLQTLAPPYLPEKFSIEQVVSPKSPTGSKNNKTRLLSTPQSIPDSLSSRSVNVLSQQELPSSFTVPMPNCSNDNSDGNSSIKDSIQSQSAAKITPKLEGTNSGTRNSAFTLPSISTRVDMESPHSATAFTCTTPNSQHPIDSLFHSKLNSPLRTPIGNPFSDFRNSVLTQWKGDSASTPSLAAPSEAGSTLVPPLLQNASKTIRHVEMNSLGSNWNHSPAQRPNYSIADLFKVKELHGSPRPGESPFRRPITAPGVIVGSNVSRRTHRSIPQKSCIAVMSPSSTSSTVKSMTPKKQGTPLLVCGQVIE